jgi:hypothetical protein
MAAATRRNGRYKNYHCCLLSDVTQFCISFIRLLFMVSGLPCLGLQQPASASALPRLDLILSCLGLSLGLGFVKTVLSTSLDGTITEFV